VIPPSVCGARARGAKPGGIHRDKAARRTASPLLFFMLILIPPGIIFLTIRNLKGTGIINPKLMTSKKF
jgi:hypothetical protein